MLFSNKVYNILKSIAMIWLPAAGTLYTSLSGLWHLPSTVEVVGSVTAVDTFLGILLGISSSSYKANPPVDGHMVVDTTDMEKPIVKSISMDPTTEEMLGKKTITIAVHSGKNETPSAPVSM
jgi:hypothetical protein